jgi:hypothetical protein
MRSKLLLVIGLAVGYVLGARAGRERYEQIARASRRVWQSSGVRKTRAEVEGYARQKAPVVRAKAESIAKATPAAVTDGARATADAARAVADRTATVATDIAERVSTVAKDVAGKTTTMSRDVADRTTGMAKDVAGRTTETAEELRERVSSTAADLRERGEDARDRVVVKASESRDGALAELDDDDDEHPELQNVDGGRAPATVEAFQPEGHRPRAGAAVHDDHGFDDPVSRLAHRRRSDGEGGSTHDLTGGLAGARRQDDTLEKVTIDVVRDPAGDLLQLPGPREDLDDAAGEVLQQRLGIGQGGPRRGLRAEEFVRLERRPDDLARQRFERRGEFPVLCWKCIAHMRFPRVRVKNGSTPELGVSTLKQLRGHAVHAPTRGCG